ncbi:DUF938 domain-containing protein [Cohaesibacter celericrescens]|uniref:DUF938 domain-containing protein n=1 Tax=Cohaesibacter celericrescens TaxID=2067669 RepID=UPI0035641CB8
MPNQDLKLHSPSTLRNRDPILELLRDVLPESGTVLEIASGSGEHIPHFASSLPALTWQPSDPSPQARESIQAWSQEETQNNLLPPLDIDTTSETWPIEYADAMIAINMVHISPWAATQGLFKKAGNILPSGGTLVLYGPYRQEGRPFVDSNAEFDAYLRAKNPAWGIRQVEDVINAANQYGLTLTSIVEMPANNLSVVFCHT